MITSRCLLFYSRLDDYIVCAYLFLRYNYDKKMSELSSADDDHPLKLSGGGGAGESVSANGSCGGGGMSFASLSVSSWRSIICIRFFKN